MLPLSQKQANIDSIAASQYDTVKLSTTPLESETDFKNSDLEYQALVQNMRVGILKKDKKGQILVANNAALTMLGLTYDQLFGKATLNLSFNVIHEDGSNFPDELHPSNVAIKTLQPVYNAVMGVYRSVTKDRIWILVNADPQFDNDGQFIHVLVTFTDISVYKGVKDELHIKNQMLDNMSQNSIDMFGIMDIEGRYRYVSKAAAVISGYTHQELLEINALDLAPKKTKDFIKQLLLKMPKLGKVENMLGKIICKDDTVKYISWSFQWDAISELIYVNGRDKTQEVKETREVEAKRIAEEQQKRHLFFESEEKKRNSIGHELHENVGQLIATVKMYLDSYERSTNEITLQKSKDLLSVCIDELRTITYINSIPNFINVGFANAIEVLLQLQFKKQAIVHALDIAIDEASISEINRINIYRIIQLWLSHIAQRDGLLSVLIAISATDEALTLQVTDEVSEAQNYTDYLSPDLMPIKERLNIIGGTMTLHPSADNKCFEITFLLKKEIA